MNELETFYTEVAKVAYGLFEKRGKLHGHDMTDWLKAEMIVKKRYQNNNEQRPPAAASPVTGKPVKKKNRQ
jgi:hypothetical protein